MNNQQLFFTAKIEMPLMEGLNTPTCGIKKQIKHSLETSLKETSYSL
jgi:hypothetical protein